MNKRLQMGAEKGLSNDFIQTVFTAIHEESISHQNKIMNPGEETDK